MTAITYDLLLGGRDTEGSIKNWIANDRVPSSFCVAQAEQWIYSRLRHRAMMASASGTLAIAATSLTIPSGLQAPIRFMFTGTKRRKLVYKLLPDLLDMYAYDGNGDRVTGQPCYFALDASNVQFDVKAYEAYPYLFYYYGTPAALSSANPTNFLLTELLTLFRYVALAFAWEHMNHPEAKEYNLKLALGEMQEALRATDEELSGAEITTSPMDPGAY